MDLPPWEDSELHKPKDHNLELYEPGEFGAYSDVSRFAAYPSHVSNQSIPYAQRNGSVPYSNTYPYYYLTESAESSKVHEPMTCPELNGYIRYPEVNGPGAFSESQVKSQEKDSEVKEQREVFEENQQTEAMVYTCADCSADVTVRHHDAVQCRECGYRVLYKKRTKRSVQYEAR